jgi:hypothetical protein
MAEHSLKLAVDIFDRIGQQADQAELFPLLLGECCSFICSFAV